MVVTQNVLDLNDDEHCFCKLFNCLYSNILFEDLQQHMRGPRKFCQRGSKFDNGFLADEGIEDPDITLNGPSSARQRNAIQRNAI